MRRRILLSALNIDPITGRGTIGIYEVVDLGLSNGLLFATCNVGATKETEYGDYYMYGKGSRKYNYGDSMYEGIENPLASSADTATQVMGSGWRMPTSEEFRDLFNNTNYEWTTINGIKGYKFTSKTNPNAYVFFPAAGVYGDYGHLTNEGSFGEVWSSTPYDSLNAKSIFFDSGSQGITSGTYRNIGFSVRGVHAAV